MKSVKLRLAALFTAFALLWLASSGGAYWLNESRWASGSNIVMHLQLGSSGTLIDGSPSWNKAAEDALALWNPFLTGVSFRVVRDSTASIPGSQVSNGVNNVFWDDDLYGEPWPDAAAWVSTWSAGGIISETDVVFNTNHSWNSYRGELGRSSRGGTLFDLRRAALHAFGHVLGLGHPDDNGQSISAIMNRASVGSGDTDSLQTDDIRGVRAIYGAPPTVNELQPGSRLLPGESLTSTGGQYRLVYQADGDLVLYDDVEDTQLWSAATAGATAGQAVMQGDGNFVVHDAQGGAVWFTGTGGNPNARLMLQLDGNIVIYSFSNRPIWDRVSASTPPPPPPEPAPPGAVCTSITTATTSLNPRVGQTVHVGAQAFDGEGRLIAGGVIFASSNPAIAAVNAATGAVTAVSEGSAIITASCAANPNVRATVTITVRDGTVELILQKAGDGDGFLISNPPGTSFEEGTQVTVTVNPNAGSIFTGWGGACAGTGACVVTMRGPGPITVIANLALSFNFPSDVNFAYQTHRSDSVQCTWESTVNMTMVVAFTLDATDGVTGTARLTGTESASSPRQECRESSHSIDETFPLTGTRDTIAFNGVIIRHGSGNVSTAIFNGAMTGNPPGTVTLTGTLRITYGGLDGSGGGSVNVNIVGSR